MHSTGIDIVHEFIWSFHTGTRAENSEYVNDVKIQATPLNKKESEIEGPVMAAPIPIKEYTPAPTEQPTP
jgi:hypothetical protein